MRKKLKKYENEIITEYQEGRSTVNQTFALKSIQHNSYEQNLGVHMLFTDLKHAYELISRMCLIECLGTLEISKNR